MLILSGVVIAQYPHEKFPTIKYRKYSKWKEDDLMDAESKINYTISIPTFFNDSNSLSIKLTLFDTLDYSLIKVYKGKKLLQKSIEKNAFYRITTPYPVYVADYNADSLMDIKFLIPNHGCGAYNNYSRVVYLLQNLNGTFTKISYTDDFFEMDRNRLERDFDGDGKFEVVTQSFQRCLSHSYWLYNLYEFEGYDLVNVNDKGNYPIMIQILNRINYDVTNKVSRNKMKKFTLTLPEDYSKSICK